jgi:fibronectin-binding autotransporter adhesin
VSLVARRPRVVLSIIALILLSAASAFGQCTLGGATVWNLGANGSWNTAGNWNPPTVPNGATTNVCITDGSSTVTLNTSPNIASLQLAARNVLNFDMGETLTVNGAQIINGGAINVNGGGNTNTFLTLANSATLSGAGTLTLATTTTGGGGNAYITGNGETLTNSSTIVGAGLIGDNGSLALNNSGTINANIAPGGATGSTGALTLQTTAAVANTGTFEATNGGTLNLTELTLNNTGGLIQATAGSTVNVGSGTTIQGGTFTTSGGGVIQTNSTTATLNGSTNAITISSGSAYTVTTNGELTVSGTFTNNGNIQINGGGNANAYVFLGGATTLQGGGTVSLSTTTTGGGGDAWLYNTTPGVTLTNVNNIIQGEGLLGAGQSMALLNQSGGTINANSTGGALIGALTVDMSGGVTNQGLMTATNSGTLSIVSTTVNNVGGNITANGASATVSLNTSTIQGGTLNTLSGGTFQTANGTTATLDASTNAITLNGTYTTGANAETFATGTFNNNGNFQINGGGNENAYILLTGNTTLQGSGGTVTLSTSTNGGGGSAWLYNNTENVTLTNINNTISGEGQIGAGQLMTLINQTGGTVNANFNGGAFTSTLELDLGGLTTNGGVGITNTGLLEASNQGTLEIASTIVNNQNGNITVNGANASVVLVDNSTIRGGALNNTGGGFLGLLSGGTGTLDGSTNGAITLNGTYTGEGNSATYLLGTINNNGNFQINGGGNTNTDLIVLDNTTLQGGGTVTLNTTTTGGGGNALFYSSGANTLTNFNNTIQGEGVLGDGTAMTIINQAGGTINANSTGSPLIGTLEIYTPAGVTNQGLMEATNSGTLEIFGTTVNNQTGNITAQGPNAVVVLADDSTIQGGTLNNTTGGFLGTGQSNTAVLDASTFGAITLNGTYTGQGNSTTQILGTFNNNGNIQINGGGNVNTVLELTANTTLQGNGSGTVTLNTTTTGGGGNAQFYTDGPLTLTNVNNTIQGEGLLGAGTAMTLINQSGGTINANSTGAPLTTTLLVQIAGSGGNPGIVNQGLMEASNNGTLELFATTVNNQGGNINAQGAGAAVVLADDSAILGGTLNNNGGFFGTGESNTATLNGSTASGAVTLNGTYTGQSNSTTFIVGTINNNGNLQIDGGGNNNTDLLLTGNTTLNGSGTVTLVTTTVGGGGNAFFYSDAGAVTLTNGNTIQGSGIIGDGTQMTIINNGTILANATAAQSLINTLTISPDAPVTNNGTMQVNPGSTLVLAAPATLTNFSGGTLTGGTYIVNGAIGNTGEMSLAIGSGTGGEITTNAANITLNGPTANTLFVDVNGNNLLSALATNTGALRVEGGYGFNTSAGTFTNGGAGIVQIGPGAGTSFSVNGGAGVYDQTSILSTALEGGTLNASAVNVSGGLLQGAGTVNAPTTTIENGGIVSPGSLALTSGGTISFTGTLTLQNGSSMNAIVAGTAAGDFGVAAVTGALTINAGASLDVVNSTGVQNGTTPIGVGTQLTIMTSGGLTGGFAGIASGNTFDNGLETWTVGKVGNDEVLNATLTPGQVITATWSGPSGNWTTTAGSAPSLTSNWTCNVPIVNFSGNDCVPVNNAPATAVYAAVLNSPGQTMTLAAGDNPDNPIVNKVTVEAGTLDIQSGANLQLTVANNGGFSQTGGTTTVDGTLSTYSGGANITGGTLEGTGSVNGNTITVGASATLLPGDGPATPGTLTFANNLVLGGTLDEVLNGGSAGQFGLLSVGQGFTLNAGSVLDILQAAGFSPTEDQTLTIATAGSPISGTFSTIQGQNFLEGSNPWTWQVLYNQGGGNNIELEAEQVIVSGNYTATWSTGNNNWSSASAWTCVPALAPCVPNNGTPAGDTYAAVLNSSGNTLTLNTAVTVNSVDLQNGTLAMSGGSLTALDTFTVETNGTITGNGTIVSPSFTNNANISNGVYADLGILDLSGSTITNYNPGTQTLTGGTWQAGLTGVGTLKLPGDIVTNSADLFLNNAGSSIVNAGGTNALAGLTSNQGGVLGVFDGASFTSGGNFTNNNGSALNASFGGSSVTISGTLTNSVNSTVTVNGTGGGASMLVTGNLTNDGTSTVQVQNGGTLTIDGGVTNSGTFVTGNAPSDIGGSTVKVTGGFTNNLGGSLTLTATGDSLTAASLSNAGTVNVDAGTTLTAPLTNSGIVNVNGTLNSPGSFVNNNPAGAINIFAGGAMTVDASAGFSTNTNASGATVFLAGSLNFIDPTYSGTCPPACNGASINGGGTITLSGGSLNFDGANGAGNSPMNLSSDNTIQGAGTIAGGTYGVTNFDLTGTLKPLGGTITINSDFNNDGTVLVNGPGNTLVLNGGNGIATFQNASTTVSNSGTLTINTFLDVGVANNGATGTLTINSGGTATIAGDLNVAINPGQNGVVDVTGAGSSLSVGGDLNFGGGASATMTVGPGATVSVSGVVTQDSGTIDIQAGGTLDPTNYLVNGGTTQVDGSLTATNVYVGTGGELTGNGGTITGNLINDGMLSPGTGVAPGTLTVNGNINLAGATGLNDGTFLELIAGLNNFGVLDDTDPNGITTLGGALDVKLLNGFQPVVGNTFTFIDPFADNGVFTNLELPNAPAGDEYIVQYNAASTELCFVSAANPVCGAASTTPPGAVPEPKSVVLLSTVIVAGLWYHRKRRQKVAAKA